MQSIKYGKTSNYSEIATFVKNPKAYRAVGTACGKNPLPLIIPCHRILSKNGMGGFTGGLDRKRFLLKLETI
jgi:methylated-DNA-[protein]-cysteine S-methyltransferase|tara:strand:- start:343 stop:558 length:216 start_codon:yes stop_codon:yes gene_type:complete